MLVNRTQIDFNKKKCRLITFNYTNVSNKLKLQDEGGKLMKAVMTYIQANIISVLNSTLEI